MSGWFSEGASSDEVDAMPASSQTTPKYPNLFWVKPDQDVKLILLDDPKMMFYYHSLFVKGDTQAIKMKVACKDGSNPDANPLKCPICNAALHDNAIGRRFGSVITAIDLTGYTDNDGNHRKHLRRVLLLSHHETKKIMKMAKHYDGSIRGLQVEVSRSQTKASSNGDHWQPMKKFNNLAKAFNKSPGVKFLFEGKQKAGETITWEEAVEQFISPSDYEKMFEPTKERLVHFLTYRGHDPDEMMGNKPTTTKKKATKAPEVDFSLEDDDDVDDVVDEADDDVEVETDADVDDSDDGLEDDSDDAADEEPEQPKKKTKKAEATSSPKKVKKGAKKTAPKADDFEDELDDFDEP